MFLQLPRRSISSNASSAGDDVPVMSMAGLLGDVKLKVVMLSVLTSDCYKMQYHVWFSLFAWSGRAISQSHINHQLYQFTPCVGVSCCLDLMLSESALLRGSACAGGPKPSGQQCSQRAECARNQVGTFCSPDAVEKDHLDSIILTHSIWVQHGIVTFT